jgi:hypothetical protein
MLDDGHVVIAQATAILAAKGIMPPEVYKTVLHSVHPDRTTDPKMKVRYEKAFQFIKEHERALAKKPLPPRPPGLPRTVEEWGGDEVACEGREKGQARSQAGSERQPAQVARPSVRARD